LKQIIYLPAISLISITSFKCPIPPLSLISFISLVSAISTIPPLSPITIISPILSITNVDATSAVSIIPYKYPMRTIHPIYHTFTTPDFNRIYQKTEKKSNLLFQFIRDGEEMKFLSFAINVMLMSF